MKIFNLLRKFTSLEELPMFANKHGMVALVYDEVAASGVNPFDRKGLMHLTGYAQKQREKYALQKEAIGALARFYGKHGIRMMVFKGYAMSLLYDVPDSRHSTDVDVFLMKENSEGDEASYINAGEDGDKLIAKKNIPIKQDEDKHSVFTVNGVGVENHAVFINVFEHGRLAETERFLEHEALVMSNKKRKDGLIFPTEEFNAAFLPLHMGGDFVVGMMKMKHLYDWVVFLNSRGCEVNWDEIYGLAKRGGYLNFLTCLNGIVIDKFGVSPECVGWNDQDVMYDAQLADKVFNTVAKDMDAMPPTSLWGKSMRFIRNRWRFKLVYSQSLFTGYILHAKSYIKTETGLIKFSIWDKK